jgi:hypothetical protein
MFMNVLWKRDEGARQQNAPHRSHGRRAGILRIIDSIVEGNLLD